jgi:hypothetical protein
MEFAKRKIRPKMAAQQKILAKNSLTKRIVQFTKISKIWQNMAIVIVKNIEKIWRDGQKYGKCQYKYSIWATLILSIKNFLYYNRII